MIFWGPFHPVIFHDSVILWQMFQPSDCFHTFPLDLLQQVHLSCTEYSRAGWSTPDKVSQEWNRVQNFVPTLAGHTSFYAAKDRLGFFGCRCALMVHDQLFTYQYPQLLHSIHSWPILCWYLGFLWPEWKGRKLNPEKVYIQIKITHLCWNRACEIFLMEAAWEICGKWGTENDSGTAVIAHVHNVQDFWDRGKYVQMYSCTDEHIYIFRKSKSLRNQRNVAFCVQEICWQLQPCPRTWQKREWVLCSWNSVLWCNKQN